MTIYYKGVIVKCPYCGREDCYYDFAESHGGPRCSDCYVAFDYEDIGKKLEYQKKPIVRNEKNK